LKQRHLILVFTIMIIFIGCGETRRTTTPNPNSQPEVWQDSAVATTTKIKVLTNMSNSDLKDYYVQRVLRARYSIDTANIYHNHLPTLIKRVDNYYMQLFIDFKDSTATISGRYGNLGLNAVAMGREPSSSNIDWIEITNNGRGWEQLSIISGNPPNSRKKYNQ
jgi:hypothetical protein